MVSSQGNFEERIAAARTKYRPEEIKCVLVAEAPPLSSDRFFYYPAVKKADHLFLAVMEILYPAEKECYLQSGRVPELKEKLLRRFQLDGFYLLDILDVPTRNNRDVIENIPAFIERLRTVARDNTPIILIKVTIYDNVAPKIRESGFKNVIPARIPFPASGQQSGFRVEFNKALQMAGLVK